MSAAPSPLAWVDRGARTIIRHWLFVVNSMAVLYAVLPWAGPVLENAGYTRLGQLIFSMYRTLCHQLPERSFFVGTSQVCYCHRCTALYTAIALTGLLYGAIRWRRPISNAMLGWAALPMLLDGLRHVASDYVPGLVLRSAADGAGSLNFWLRIITGTIFGVAAVLWLHPRMHQTFAEASR